MNDFTQAKEYLDKQLKENCDQLDKFLMQDVYASEDLNNLFADFYHVAREKVKSGFFKDCEIFKESNETFSKIVPLIFARGSEKINNIALHKHILLTVKIRKHDGEIDKYTLLEWLSEKDEL